MIGIRKLLLGATLAVAVLAAPSTALANLHVAHYLSYGSCCGGAVISGTRAYVTVSSTSPQSTDCLLQSSVVEELNATKLLQAGLVKCGSSASLDGTCSLTNNFVKFVERYNGSSYTCYPHGAATTGSSYLSTVDDSGGTGTWTTYIAGTSYESQSGYDNNVWIFEWGEDTGSSCTGWSHSGSFSTWQRYYYAGNTWSTVSSASDLNEGCWTLGALSSGSYTVSH